MVQRRAEPTGRAETGEAAVNELVERLAQQFPELEPDDIRRAVNGHATDSDSSRGREPVPAPAARGESAVSVPRYRA